LADKDEETERNAKGLSCENSHGASFSLGAYLLSLSLSLFLSIYLSLSLSISILRIRNLAKEIESSRQRNSRRTTNKTKERRK